MRLLLSNATSGKWKNISILKSVSFLPRIEKEPENGFFSSYRKRRPADSLLVTYRLIFVSNVKQKAFHCALLLSLFGKHFVLWFWKSFNDCNTSVVTHFAHYFKLSQLCYIQLLSFVVPFCNSKLYTADKALNLQTYVLS